MDYTVATINISAITSAAKLDALYAFIQKIRASVVLLQEVAVPVFNFRGFQEVVNTGEQRRGTAILVRDNLPMSAPTLLPCGRAVSVRVGETCFLCVYAPSGARQSSEREDLFSLGLTPLLAAAGETIVAGGDWNCVVRARGDSTGSTPQSKALASLLSAMGLRDAWTSLRQEPGHTFYAGRMSARLDRVYVTGNLLLELRAACTTAVACSADHLALTVSLAARLGLGAQQPSAARSKRGNDQAAWKLDNRILQDPDFEALLAARWAALRAKKSQYTSLTEWWLRCAKPQVRALAAEFTREVRKDLANKLDFLQSALQELCAVWPRTAADTRLIREVKKEIVELHALRLRGVLDRAKLDSVIADEPVSLHHVASMRRRARQQSVNTLETADGEVLTEHEDISKHFYEVFKNKFKTPAAQEGSTSLLDELEPTICADDNAALCQDITLEEVAAAVKKSAPHKSPGEDGITGDFYKAMFHVVGQDLTAVLNEIWSTARVPEAFMRGIIVMVPKGGGARVVKDYRPITLLNMDMKLFARVQAARLLKLSDKLLHRNQVRPGGKRTMTGALCDLRDVISAAQALKTPACVLSVDFSGAFDNVNHEFMFQVLTRRGVGGRVMQVLKAMYSVATSRMRINGELTEAFPIDRSVRQGCPYSALLFAIVLSALAHYLERRLQGLRLASACLKLSAYADDAFFVLRSILEVGVCNGAFREFGAAAGLSVNPAKSGALAVGGWDTGTDMGYEYVADLKVLGVRFTGSTKQTIALNWKAVLDTTKGVLASNVARALSLSQRAEFIVTYAMSKVWHVAQVLPDQGKVTGNIMQAAHMFLFKGHLFKVKGILCCQPWSMGGLGIPDLFLKCNALFAGRWQSLLLLDEDSFAAEWLQVLLRRYGVGNPPNSGAVWPEAAHYRSFMAIRAYSPAPVLTRSARSMVRELYRVQTEAHAKERHRVEAHHPGANWTQVWTNLASPVLSAEVRDQWFVVIHDLPATNARLFELQDTQRRHPTGRCASCEQADTLLHRLTVCGGSRAAWKWLGARLARLVGEPARPEWLIRPEFDAPSEPRQAAAVWLAAQGVAYLAGGGRPTLGGMLDQLQREHGKVLGRPTRWPTSLIDGFNWQP